ALVVVGELLPIRVARRGTSDEVTVSTPFAFAILLSYGVFPALVAYVAAYIVAATVERVSPLKLAFNAAQYALSLLAGAGVLAIWTGGREAARSEHRALHDELTGLPNRQLFQQTVEAALHGSRRSGGSLAVVIMDLDDFKAVNDTLGHEQGDRLLAAIAPRL